METAQNIIVFMYLTFTFPLHKFSTVFLTLMTRNKIPTTTVQYKNNYFILIAAKEKLQLVFVYIAENITTQFINLTILQNIQC